MRIYVNPPNETNEVFLKREGFPVSTKLETWEQVPAGQMPVFLIKNSFFKAAFVAFCEEELRVINNASDTRPKEIFLVSTNKLMSVVDDPEQLKDYI